MRTAHRAGLGVVVLVVVIAGILLYGPPWVRAPIAAPAGPGFLGERIDARLDPEIPGTLTGLQGWNDAPAPYVERRSACELLNAGYGIPQCDRYGPAFAFYRQENPFYDRLSGGPNPYSRGYGVEGRGWQLP